MSAPPALPTGSALAHPASPPPPTLTCHPAVITSLALAAELSDGKAEASHCYAAACCSPRAQRAGALACSVHDATCDGSEAPLLEPPAAVRRAAPPLLGGAQQAPALPSALFHERHGEAPLGAASTAVLDPTTPQPLFGDEDSAAAAVVAQAFADFGRQLCRDVALRAGGARAVEPSAPQVASHAAAVGEQALVLRGAVMQVLPPRAASAAVAVPQRGATPKADGSPAATPKAAASAPTHSTAAAPLQSPQRRSSALPPPQQYIGVQRASWSDKEWVAYVYVGSGPSRRKLNCGSYSSPEAAARAHDNAARKRNILALNFPRPGTDEVQAVVGQTAQPRPPPAAATPAPAEAAKE